MILHTALGALAAATVLLSLLLWRQGRRLRGQERAGAALRAELESMQRELDALCTGALGAGAHLGRVDRQLLRLVERQDRLELRDTTHREYERAMKLIRTGADVGQLMGECGLTRAEAELLARMHAADAPRGAAAGRADQSSGGVGMRLSGSPM